MATRLTPPTLFLIALIYHDAITTKEESVITQRNSMATRKASFEDDETPQKRPRLLEGVKEQAPAAPTATVTCFDSLNNDCLVNILSFLPNEDMNNVSECKSKKQ